MLASSSGSPVPRKLGAARFPQPPPFGALLESPYSPRVQTRKGAVRDAEAKVRFSTPSPLSAPRRGLWRPGCPGRNPHTKLPAAPTSAQRAEHSLGPRSLAPLSAPPSAPAGYGRSRPGAAAASTATGSLPASGHRRPPALLSMSRHRPRPGLRLGTARAGAAVQAPAPAGSGHSSPGGFASAPRSRSRSV